MNYKIIFTFDFERNFKRLAKKYHSLKSDLLELINELRENPFVGESLGNNNYKIRLAIKSKGKGKSGGARIITYVLVRDNEVYLVMIYDKSERSSVSIEEIKRVTRGIKK